MMDGDDERDREGHVLAEVLAVAERERSGANDDGGGSETRRRRRGRGRRGRGGRDGVDDELMFLGGRLPLLSNCSHNANVSNNNYNSNGISTAFSCGEGPSPHELCAALLRRLSAGVAAAWVCARELAAEEVR